MTSWDEQTLFAEGSLARTYPSQESELDSPEREPDYSGMHLLSRRMSKQSGSSWKMSPDYSHQIKDAISGQSSLHWPTQGMCIWNGGCLIRSSSESPSAAVACSLSDVLESQVSDRYLLSAKAAAGILRRSSRRGKKLPEPLEAALVAVAGHQTPTE